MSRRDTRWAYPIVLFPSAIRRSLDQIENTPGLPTPNLWQVALGAVRMVHRLCFRTETVGTCAEQTVRQNWRARLLQYRPIRVPFLLTERAIAPLDLTGLASGRERVIRHLLGAHHDGNQFAYDLQMLSIWPGALLELSQRVDAVVEARDPRSDWLRDLTVFEGYHEKLQTAVHHALNDGVRVTDEEAMNPDVSFYGFLRWCSNQSETPRATLTALRCGRFSFDVDASC